MQPQENVRQNILYSGENLRKSDELIYRLSEQVPYIFYTQMMQIYIISDNIHLLINGHHNLMVKGYIQTPLNMNCVLKIWFWKHEFQTLISLI